MTILQCEACGAPLPVKGRTKTYTCEYCGTSQTITLPVTNKKADTMYKRALKYIEEGIKEIDFRKRVSKQNKAKEYVDKILDEFPDYSKAYVLYLMLDNHVCKEEELGEEPSDISDSEAYQIIMQKGDPELKSRIRGYYLSSLSVSALFSITQADTCEELKKAKKFVAEHQSELKQSKELIAKCDRKFKVLKYIESEAENIEELLSKANHELKICKDENREYIVNTALNEVKKYCDNRFSKLIYRPLIVEIKENDSFFSFNSGTQIRIWNGRGFRYFEYNKKHELHVTIGKCHINGNTEDINLTGEVPKDIEPDSSLIGVSVFESEDRTVYDKDFSIELAKLPVLVIEPPSFLDSINIEVKYLL